ncbi:MAG: NADH-quinone oxidoreductase subunit L [Chloroherpetonaceae bacterium]|nr:NADH-quinone oxidoreductase subunit L [Chloroherpetonaceae bacterium]
MHQLISYTVILPLVGFLFNSFLFLFSPKAKKNTAVEQISGTVGTAVIFGSFVISLLIFFELVGLSSESRLFIVPVFDWFYAGNLSVSFSYQVDTLSMAMSLAVSGVGCLIHLYSIGYMHGDEDFARFFAYLNLFIFSMMNLILADNLIVMFLGWEGVGLCSYLLIGFWYQRKFDGVEISTTGEAADKAFIMNRIGDFAMLAAFFILFQAIGSFNFQAVLIGKSALTNEQLFWVTILIFIGCTGKSAQIPLFTWLPDAMAGPTPVSALIHAATMVTSGLYLTARLSPIFYSSPETQIVIASIGATTAILAASIALFQNDIKKVLAYSTVSQLGYMFLAVGVGAYSTAIFHVITHAFFKACLFLGSGSVIHALHEEQDIRKMGGLHKKMPITSLTFLIGSLALAGFPLTSGFFSKDEILTNTFAGGYTFFYVIGLFTALLTAFYSIRLYTLTFLGDSRIDSSRHPLESPLTMTIPLILLASLSLLGGFLGLPEVISSNNFMKDWLLTSTVLTEAHKISHSTEWVLLALSAFISIIGVSTAYFIYSKNIHFLSNETGFGKLAYQKYLVDEIYDRVAVKSVQFFSEKIASPFERFIIKGFFSGFGESILGLGNILRMAQTGVAQNYAIIMALGFVLILGVVIFSGK